MEITDDGEDRYISEILIERREDDRNFATGSGDHSTAYVVLRHWAENTLGGLPLQDVGAALDEMSNTVRSLPYYTLRLAVSEDVSDRVTQLAARAEVCIARWKARAANLATLSDGDAEGLLCTAVQAILAWRNNIPLSAIEFGSVGRGEGPAARYLDRLNYDLDEGNIHGLSREQRALARKHVMTLFDTRTAREFVSSISPMDEPSLPGLNSAEARHSGGAYGAMLEQHTITIRHAYPALWDAMGGELAEVIAAAAQHDGDYKDADYNPKDPND